MEGDHRRKKKKGKRQAKTNEIHIVRSGHEHHVNLSFSVRLSACLYIPTNLLLSEEGDLERKSSRVKVYVQWGRR